MQTAHQKYIHRCLQLAQKAAGWVAPNPMVGAILLYKNKIIGEGFHQRFGEAHAEVNCLRSVREEDRAFIPESTLYVSLEPCSFVGKTPACSQLIIDYRIPEVVIAGPDPHHMVSGAGVAQLQQAGVKIRVGILEKEAQELNKHFFCFHKNKRPFFHLKWAQSRDGKIAAEDYTPIKISHPATDVLMHKLRTQNMGILVGVHTVLKDNPALTGRHWPGRNPARILIDKTLQIPDTAKIMQDDTPKFIFNNEKDMVTGSRIYIRINQDEPLCAQIAAKLYEHQINSVLVEGGRATTEAFITAGIWDEATIITHSEMIVGKGIAAPILKNARLQYTETIYRDRISTYIKAE